MAYADAGDPYAGGDLSNWGNVARGRPSFRLPQPAGPRRRRPPRPLPYQPWRVGPTTYPVSVMPSGPGRTDTLPQRYPPDYNPPLGPGPIPQMHPTVGPVPQRTPLPALDPRMAAVQHAISPPMIAQAQHINMLEQTLRKLLRQRLVG